jgi:hypothetical protein
MEKLSPVFLTLLNNIVEHALATVKYVTGFPLFHHLPLLLWLTNGSNCGTNCFTSMSSTVTEQWSGYHGSKTQLLVQV